MQFSVILPIYPTSSAQADTLANRRAYLLSSKPAFTNLATQPHSPRKIRQVLSIHISCLASLPSPTWQASHTHPITSDKQKSHAVASPKVYDSVIRSKRSNRVTNMHVPYEREANKMAEHLYTYTCVKCNIALHQQKGQITMSNIQICSTPTPHSDQAVNTKSHKPHVKNTL